MHSKLLLTKASEHRRPFLKSKSKQALLCLHHGRDRHPEGAGGIGVFTSLSLPSNNCKGGAGTGTEWPGHTALTGDLAIWEMGQGIGAGGGGAAHLVHMQHKKPPRLDGATIPRQPLLRPCPHRETLANG